MFYIRTVVFSLFLTVFVTGLSDVIRTCNKIDNCKCQFSDNNAVISLWPLAKGTPPLFKNAPGADGLQYSYSPCLKFDEGDCKNAAICQKNDKETTKLANLSALFRMSGSSVSIHYEYNDSLSVVNLICNAKDSMPMFQAQGKVSGKGNKYMFNLTSEYACAVQKGKGQNGLTAGSIILIVFFVCLCVYLIIGVLHAKFRKNATGLDLIPNIEFWSALPGLIGHGFGFVITCSCCTQRSKSTYDEV